MMKKQKTRKSSKMQAPALQDLAKRYWLFVTVGSMSILVITAKLFDRTSVMSMSITNIDISAWLKTPYLSCDLNFIGYGRKFAVLRNAHVNVKTGTFLLPCAGERPKYRFEEGGIKGNILTIKQKVKGNILNSWMKNMSTYDMSRVKDYEMAIIKTATFAVNRIEAHNLYHAVCEWYSVFLISYLLHFDPMQIEILFMDDRPSNKLDETWSTLFGKVTKYDVIPTDNVFKTLIWNIFGYESPMNTPELETIPYISEFREFVLASLGINNERSLNCEKLHVTVILRRDYQSHPELADGLVLRKFKNNSRIFDIVRTVFNDHFVKGIYLENFSMREQLEIITNTDILIGMHGAGLSHILFLPEHAGCFEMFPKYVGDFKFFEAFSRWRGIKYTSWRNYDSANEFPEFKTMVPTEILVEHLNTLKHRICS